MEGEEEQRYEPTTILSEPWDVDRRLGELGLSRQKLLHVAAVALSEGFTATPYHCANASGTLAYQHGTFALRDKFVPDGWKTDRTEGVESIRQDDLRIRVAFTNVDIACDFMNLPKPRSEKGAGAERASMNNLFGADLPHFAPRQRGGYALYYLMTAEDGRTELTRPIVRNRTFVAAIERIFLGAPGDHDYLAKRLGDSDDAANNFDPVVARKP